SLSFREHALSTYLLYKQSLNVHPWRRNFRAEMRRMVGLPRSYNKERTGNPEVELCVFIEVLSRGWCLLSRWLAAPPPHRGAGFMNRVTPCTGGGGGLRAVGGGMRAVGGVT